MIRTQQRARSVGARFPATGVPGAVSGPGGAWQAARVVGEPNNYLSVGCNCASYIGAGPKAHQYTSAGCLESMSLKSGPSICFVLERESIWSHKKRKRKTSTFPPLVFIIVRFFSLNSKTRQTTSLNFLNRAFYLFGEVLKAVLL